MPAAIRGEINDSLPYPLEIGAQLDGVIRSKWRGKPLAGVTANVLAPRMADGASAVTDSLGRFPHHRNRMARLYILCNKRHELKGKTRRKHSS